MCDTLVATPSATADGVMLLAKNSDRDPNEAQALTYVPHRRHAPGSTVRCTYIEVPQVAETYEVVLSRPYWLWGAEMGANEYGVAIGNEAVWTREPLEKGPGLIGMDLLRLGLERASTSRQALDVITALIAIHGQGGNCSARGESYYHNSFIIADPKEAWVLETAGRYWVAERVQEGSVRTISNLLTIGEHWDLASPGLAEHAVAQGWHRAGEPFHFARCYADPSVSIEGGQRRHECSTGFLQAAQGQATVQTMMAALRHHGSEPDWYPGEGMSGDTLCMHACRGAQRGGQSTGSLVARLAPDLPAYWLTGTSGPCTGLFKPVYLGGAGLPDLGPEPDSRYDPATLWWAHERLQRAIAGDYRARLGAYRDERDELEAAFLAEAGVVEARCRSLSGEARAQELRALSASCFGRAQEATARWLERVERMSRSGSTGLFSPAWDECNREVGMA